MESEGELERVMPNIECNCERRDLSGRISEFYNRLKDPTATEQSALDDMGLVKWCCRNYMINFTKMTTGTWRSGDLTKTGEKIRYLPKSILRHEPPSIIAYDKWNPVPLPKNMKKVAKRFELTPHIKRDPQIEDFINLYVSLDDIGYSLLEVWASIRYPDDELGSLICAAFFLELLGSTTPRKFKEKREQEDHR